METTKLDSTRPSQNPTHEFRNGIHRAELALPSIAQEAGEKMGNLASQFAHTASESAKSGREYVVENPAKGIALAAATGLVMGSILTMALRRRD